MKIKKGDKVVIVSGKDKGKTGTVSVAFPRENRIVVEGVNIRKKHQRSRTGKKGQVVEKAMPVHVSNVMLVDPKGGKPTRVSISRDEKGARTRVAVKSKQALAT